MTDSCIADRAPLLELRGISKSYGKVHALRGVDLSFVEGELVALLGDNGAGKSTLIKVLSGLERPDEGQMIWRGQAVDLNSPREAGRLGIETIFQDGALVDGMSIARNIFMGREPTNRLGLLALKRMRETAQKVLSELVHIDGIGSCDRTVGELSGGQKQAVAIARAIHFQRTMLLLDEPTSALAVKATQALLDHLRVLKRRGITSVLITHNLYHAFELCDRFLVMNRGRVVFEAAKADTSIEELTGHVTGVPAGHSS